MRNNDLVKYITQLQAKLFRSPSLLQRRPGQQAPPSAGPTPTGPGGWPAGGEFSLAFANRNTERTLYGFEKGLGVGYLLTIS